MTATAVGKAWQRQIRERAAERDDAQDYQADISTAEVKPVDYRTARSVIEEYEWLGRMSVGVRFNFGIYFGERLGGVVVYSNEYAENLGVWDKYGYTNKIILLSRGACVHWAHPHSASKLIRGSMRMLPLKYEVVTATVDSKAGEVGTIYQACAFDYIGAMSANVADGALIDGKSQSRRTLRDHYGTDSIPRLKKLLGDEHVTRIENLPKGRYFAFRGSPRMRKRNRAAIAHMIKPYPQRSEGATDAAIYEGMAA